MPSDPSFTAPDEKDVLRRHFGGIVMFSGIFVKFFGMKETKVVVVGEDK